MWNDWVVVQSSLFTIVAAKTKTTLNQNIENTQKTHRKWRVQTSNYCAVPAANWHILGVWEICVESHVNRDIPHRIRLNKHTPGLSKLKCAYKKNSCHMLRNCRWREMPRLGSWGSKLGGDTGGLSNKRKLSAICVAYSTGGSRRSALNVTATATTVPCTLNCWRLNGWL